MSHIHHRPSAPRLVSRCSRLPYGVSGWVDLSSCHRYLGFGFVVYQRRFFEIDWEKRTISYYNSCKVDGDFVYGVGARKEIQMSSIIRLDFPSTQAYPQSGVPSSLGPFDIITPDRIYTLVPLPPSPSPPPPTSHHQQQQQPSRPPAKDIWETPNEQSRHQSTNSQVSYISAPESSYSLFAFNCCAPVVGTTTTTNHQTSSNKSVIFDAMNATLTVKDFKHCIVDSSLISNPTEAGGTVAKLLLKRDVNDGGIPWEFECPLTLEIMEDPVVASDGKTYEREAIEEWFERSGLTSVDGSKMTSNELVPNYRLREEITAYNKAKQILRESHSQHPAKSTLTSPSSSNKNKSPRSPRSSTANWW